MAKSRWGLALQAAFYIAAGTNHLWHPTIYRQIMPAHYGHPASLVAASGIAEMAAASDCCSLRRARRPQSASC